MTRQNTSQTIYKRHGTDDEAGDDVFQHNRHCLAPAQAPKTKKKLENQPLTLPRPAQEEGLRLPSGAKVMHNGQWVGLDEWGRAAAALRVRPEAIEIKGGLCVLSTKNLLDAMKENHILEEGICHCCNIYCWAECFCKVYWSKKSLYCPTLIFDQIRINFTFRNSFIYFLPC